MAGINLSQSTQLRNQQPKSPLFDKSFMIPLMLLIIAFGTYGGLVLYNSSLDSKAKELETEITTQTAGLNNTSVDRVIDFQDRLTNIDEKLKIDETMAKSQTSGSDMLAVMEKTIVSGVSIDAYKYNMTAKNVTLKVLSSDFKGIARQVTNFKSVPAFSNVMVSDTSKADDGTISANVVISL